MELKMRCPDCKKETPHKKGKTSLGYQAYQCKACHLKYNDRTSTQYNYLEYPTDIVMQTVRWYIRYRLSYANLSEMLAERGLEITAETIRLWVKMLAPEITKILRKKRGGKCGQSWYIDETYIKIKGQNRYVYRAIDRTGNLVDCMVSAKRNMAAARRFFKQALSVTEITPDRATTDGHDSYPKAIKNELGKSFNHRINRYLNNYTEQSHRNLKQRIYPLRGFGNFYSAYRVCQAFDECRNFFVLRRRKEYVSEKMQRTFYLDRLLDLECVLKTA